MDERKMLEGCSDGNCVILKPAGMHTNGGCRCFKYPENIQKFRDELAALKKDRDEWRDAAQKERDYSIGVEENRDNIVLQIDQMRDVVDAACAYETFMGHDELNSAYRNKRETTDAFVKAVGAYKTRLPEK